MNWATPTVNLAEHVREQSRRCLSAYREDPHRVEEDAAIEVQNAEGGYGRKQIHELIQNAADAMMGEAGGIEVHLADRCLYVANAGRPFSAEGIDALMASHISRKRGDEIGRFGLGFKSVSAVTDRPDIFSRTVSFGFDRQRAATRIRTVVPSAPKYPLLRLAEPLDPDLAASEDPVLADLMGWATTVIRLPLKVGAEVQLREDFDLFPSRFVLFAPHVSQLVMQDSTRGRERMINVARRHGDTLDLDDGGTQSSWEVVSVDHRPSPAALEDAGELAKRDRITVHWAIPNTDRGSLGELWAYFPTGAQTTLSGLLNAPWKLSEDRLSLIRGRFNEEVLTEVIPALLARSLARLQKATDPSAYLDVLPSRGRESRNWADDIVNEPVFAHLRAVPSLPDLEGQLRRPSEMRLTPRDVQSSWLTEWRAAGPPAHEWVHEGVNRTGERRHKAERLAGEASIAKFSDWLEALVAVPSVEASAHAIRLLAKIVREDPKFAPDGRVAKILMLEDGRLVPPVPGRVFVRNSLTDSGYAFIDSRLAADESVTTALKQLGIEVLDPAGSLRNALLHAVANPRVEWGHIWPLTRSVELDLAAQIFREVMPHPIEAAVRVRSAAGSWRTIATSLLGGEVIPSAGKRDRALLVDPGYHAQDIELLTRLGAVSQPVVRSSSPTESWVGVYQDTVADQFIAEAKGSKPSRDKIQVRGSTPPWPLEMLPALSDDGRVRMTELVLMADSGASWTAKHATNNTYGQLKVMSPASWWLRKHGRLQTKVGPWAVGECLCPADDVNSDVLPVPDVSEAMAKRLRLAKRPADLAPGTWAALVATAEKWSDDRRRSSLYSWAVHFIDAPQLIVAAAGGQGSLLPPSDVAVAGDEETYRALQEQHIAVVLADEEGDEDGLRERWGLAEGRRLLQRELVVEASGEPNRLADVYPGLRLYLPPELASVDLQRCTAINLITPTPRGQKSQRVPGVMHEGRVAITAVDDAAALAQISNALSLGLDDVHIRTILSKQEAQRQQQLRKEIRAAKNDDERLALAVGEDALRRSIPGSALRSVKQSKGREATPAELAAMARAVHGAGVLHYFKAVLDANELNPPGTWAGLSPARRFVSDLGFPAEFAGTPADRRPAVFEVEGPSVIGELHDYQRIVAAGIKRLLGGEGPARGMVSLPTGAGKTRVAVQAFIEEVAEGRLRGPLLWIAQSDELCEQAVQTWAYVWRAVGPSSRLTLNRFWSDNDVVEDPSAFQVVIATDAKVLQAVKKNQHEWLTEAQVVVVDEAHTSISPTYTQIFEWAGRGRSRAMRRPLIGLTATPFRNVNELETQRLINRYDGNRLDEGAFQSPQQAYSELQRRGILAAVRQRELAGVDVAMSQSEMASIDQFLRLPAEVEERLGEDVERNRRIVDDIVALPKDWPVLLFASSIENARALAALLTLEGVRSVAISAETDTAVRRRSVAGFQSGDIRVITNYNVLAQGFDAPAVRAVYVTRPTFSTNLYQQMIGRGLRGPKNGGSDEVLIVNVRDNLQQYGQKLAFYDFEYLWSRK